MQTSDIVMSVIVLIAPFMAVFAQRQIDIYREKRNRRLAVFKALMATRGTTLAPSRIEALNMIDLEFADRRSKEVVLAWKAYLDHLTALSNIPREQRDKMTESWLLKSEDLTSDLLYEMGKTLGYQFDKVHLKRSIYHPQGHIDIENEQTLIRKLLLEVLEGDRQINTLTTVTSAQSQPPSSQCH